MGTATSTEVVLEPLREAVAEVSVAAMDTDDETLLATRICRLDLSIETSRVAHLVRRLYRELETKGLAFRPLCYLSDEWGCPDEVPAIGIPFWLAHRRLLAIERSHMLTVEGSGEAEFMRLLRHEAGHAFNYAFGLYERQDWQETFGPFRRRYPERYRFQPYSRRFVRHLASGYAQRHPDEDFAETFAVWLTPRSGWRRVYAGTEALAKLLYVDEATSRLADRRCPVPRRGALHGNIDRLRLTLRSWYNRRRRIQALDLPDAHDDDLREIFRGHLAGRTAAAFIRRRSKMLVDRVAHWTGERKHVIRPLVGLLISRARALGIGIWNGTEEDVFRDLLTYVTTLTMNYAYYGRYLVET